MKVLVHNVKANTYFQGGIAWTCNPIQAFDFETPNAAEGFCRDNDLVHVEIILQPTERRRSGVRLKLRLRGTGLDVEGVLALPNFSRGGMESRQ